METKFLLKYFRQNFKPIYIFVIFIVLGALIAFLTYSVQQKVITKEKREDNNKIGSKIVITDGDTTITINDEGIVEFKNSEKVFYQKWDSNKIKAIFKRIKNMAKANDVKNSQTNQENKSADSYVISFTDKGSEQVVNIPTNDGQIGSIVDIIDSFNATEGSLSDYFDHSSPPPPSEISFYEGENVDQEGQETRSNCELWGQQISEKSVISNTVCIKEKEEE